MKESVTGGSRIPSWESDEEDHTGPQAAFAKAFAKQNIHFEKGSTRPVKILIRKPGIHCSENRRRASRWCP